MINSTGGEYKKVKGCPFESGVHHQLEQSRIQCYVLLYENIYIIHTMYIIIGIIIYQNTKQPEQQ